MNINNISNLNPLEQKSSKNDNLLDQSFSDILTKTLGELNDVQQKADKAVADLATGEVKDLHQAAIAIGKAETSMKLMLEVRNKAISAYKEIARTQL
ncbi:MULTISPECIES: flagellar hook-basal body complex protein FliE [Campylobacter]|jgi:flagellar hook-basal body complex protein FliE|uniref:Flagellar hook-basal body complex protein FliE n=1 Tax=Campylobacter devanensis TaxID=3161138 RepID=A0A1X9SSR6_9BACT|nr:MULTISPECIES: flagellar hook-basal body complex protein FliE [Campylobacter]MEE3693579.1 flagellar hook-basal body complex protein FliE [Campylobacter sp. CLAX-22107-21]MEE3711467.1 flagellar hook-basal body complex protein FliE [Campylobacter sp. CLAX-7218-21]ARQ99242.1 flagellar proximal rod protein [Campylobacter lanienae]MBO7155745.1 flagellar hook-basal body complex protein FliE [Campylobacter sp.]MBP3674904.1 flagellar hook-basal body complex protein FliE [Campylobacter sp.]